MPIRTDIRIKRTIPLVSPLQLHGSRDPINSINSRNKKHLWPGKYVKGSEHLPEEKSRESDNAAVSCITKSGRCTESTRKLFRGEGEGWVLSLGSFRGVCRGGRKSALTNSGYYSRLLHIARWNIEQHAEFIVSPGRRGTDLRPLSPHPPFRPFARWKFTLEISFPSFPFSVSLSLFSPLFLCSRSTGVDTLSLSTADDSIEESRARQVGKERVSRQFRPSFIRFIPRVVKYPAAGWWDSKGNSVFGKHLNRGSGVGEAFSSSPRRALHYHDL